mmetsp:Transcript_78708/g.152050  ORF Transcript_78708/g.152050 Transcript_78708/m.152050 type:complete len:203 (+) Transcript_78708:346-954(+)
MLIRKKVMEHVRKGFANPCWPYKDLPGKNVRRLFRRNQRLHDLKNARHIVCARKQRRKDRSCENLARDVLAAATHLGTEGGSEGSFFVQCTHEVTVATAPQKAMPTLPAPRLVLHRPRVCKQRGPCRLHTLNQGVLACPRLSTHQHRLLHFPVRHSHNPVDAQLYLFLESPLMQPVLFISFLFSEALTPSSSIALQGWSACG